MHWEADKVVIRNPEPALYKKPEVKKEVQQVVEKPEEPEELEDEFPMNSPEKPDWTDKSDDELRTIIKTMNRSASPEVKVKIKEIITSYGAKLAEVDRDGLLDILDLFEEL